jgi:hypothetical protein
MNPLVRFCPLAVLLTSLLYAFPAVKGHGQAAGTYGKPPLTFERRGAGSNGLPFAAYLSGHSVSFGVSGTVFETSGSDQPEAMLQFAGARPNVRPQAAGPQAGIANYFIGSQPEQWRTAVPLFKKIKYAGLYPGVDLIYYGNQNRLEYDLVVAPGASWRSIRLAFRGAQGVGLGGDGNLRILTGSGWITHGRPMVYQRGRDGRREVSGNYVLLGGNEVGFEIGAYDYTRALIIDPTLAYASYLGGSGDDYGHAVAIDSSGCAYVVGETGSVNFPTHGPEQSSLAGASNVFVTKWNAAGTGLAYATYIGGSDRDVALDVTVDTAGNAYLTGFTYSGNFPITTGALRASFVGESKAFVLKLNPSGNALVYSTFLGGSGDDYGTGIAVDPAGEAHIAGYTDSVDFPTTAGAFQHYYGGGAYDGFLAKLNAAGSALVYATYLGGSANDTAAGVAVDQSGNIYVTGQTQSSNFPTVNPVQATNSESDAFVVKMNSAGQVLYATYLGGTGLTNGNGIAADAAGNAYVTGFTNAPDFPVTANAYQAANNGAYDGFVAVLNAYGSSVVSATYLGGSGSDVSYGIALDGSGNVYIAGSTNSSDFPVQAAIQPAYSGGGDAFVAGFNNQLTSLLYATYFGGSGSDVAAGIATDLPGNAYITGWTSSGESSSGLPITPGAFQPIGMGGLDAFVAKFSVGGSSIVCGTSTPQALTVQAGSDSQLVGDFLLSCTGGTIGTQVTANIQATLNTNVAGASQAEAFIGLNTTPVWGAASGNSSIVFQGVSFTAPGPSATTTLRITQVSANVSAVAAGGQVVMTVSASNSSPSIIVAPAQQTVAVVPILSSPQVEQLVLSKVSPPAGCGAPSPASGFLISDAQALVWVLVANTSAGDVARVDWSGPNGTSVYQSHSFTVTGNGTQCLWDSLSISGAPMPMAGQWTVNVYWNNTLLASAPFSISAAGAAELIWQNGTTRQTNANYYGGASGSTIIGWACLNCATGLAGWRVVGAGDFDGNGVPDLVWQNQTTGQVNVNYYGGAGGATIIGWAMLNSGAGTAGWSVVAVADMNGDGVPDLIWQNSTTGQVNVNYYGGTGGATVTGWAVLNSGAGTSGWHVVAAADFDGNGVPDLIWQNSTTGQVNVNYYGGSRGATLTGWAMLNSGAGTSGWHVVAADFNSNGVPGLIWQNQTTGQVNVNYYGGSRGATLTGWACLNSGAGTSGWQVVAAWPR